jgi:hypothetical protein
MTLLFNWVVSVLLFGQVIKGDVYMHNPRGSNDRNCERNVNRNNENRLFDSQNNNNGGYACQRPVGDETMQVRFFFRNKLMFFDDSYSQFEE